MPPLAAVGGAAPPPPPPTFPPSPSPHPHPHPRTALRDALACGDDARVHHLLDLLDYDVDKEDVAYARGMGAREEVVRALIEQLPGGGAARGGRSKG